MKRQKIKFWILISIDIIMMLSDGLLTYINTPDLKMEGNPLVSVFGLSWISLGIANILIFILIFGTAYYSYIKYETVINDKTTYKEYFSQILYDRPDKFWASIYKTPKHFGPAVASYGYAMLYASIVARIVLVFEWLCETFNINNSKYIAFTNKFCFSRPDVILGIIVFIVMMFYWFYKEFKSNLQQKEIEN